MTEETLKSAAHHGQAGASKAKAGRRIEVVTSDGTTRQFHDVEHVRREILNGSVGKDWRARVRMDGDQAGDADKKWSSIEDIAGIDFKLESLYRPIRAHAKRGGWIGLLVGIAIKAIDTGLLLSESSRGALLFWLLVGGALILMSVVNRGWMVAAAMGFISVKYGVNVFGLLGMWFSTALVGGFYGGLVGMAIGTIVGYIRRRSLQRATDAQSEGNKPLLTRFAIPLAIVAVAAPLHLLWLNPKLIAWLS